MTSHVSIQQVTSPATNGSVDDLTALPENDVHDFISLLKSLYAVNIETGPKLVSSIRTHLATWRFIYQSLSPDSVVAFHILASMGPNCERFVQYALEHRFDGNNADNLDINNFVRNADKWAKLLKLTGSPATLSTQAFSASSKKHRNRPRNKAITCYRCMKRGHTSSRCQASWEEAQAAQQDKDDKVSKEGKSSRAWFAEALDGFTQIVDDDLFVSYAFESKTFDVCEKFGANCFKSFDDSESKLFQSSELCVSEKDCFGDQDSECGSYSELDVNPVDDRFIGCIEDPCFVFEPCVGSGIDPYDSEPFFDCSIVSCLSDRLVGSDGDICLPCFDFLVDVVVDPSTSDTHHLVDAVADPSDTNPSDTNSSDTPKAPFFLLFYLFLFTIILLCLILLFFATFFYLGFKPVYPSFFCC